MIQIFDKITGLTGLLVKITAGGINLIILHRLKAVSYTHLDVYKRQQQILPKKNLLL